MTPCLVALLLLWNPTIPAAAGPSPVTAAAGTVPAFFEGLESLGGTSLRTAIVADFSLERDAGTFVMVEGRLALLEIDGKPVGALYSGDGRFRVAPRNAVDRAQLERLYGSEEPELTITGAMLLFNDETAADFAGLQFVSEPPTGRLRDLLRNGVAFLTDDGHTSFDTEVVEALVNDQPGAFFHAHLEVAGKDPHFFRFRENSIEEVSFGRKAEGPGRSYETVSSFDSGSEPIGGDRGDTELPAVSVMRIEIDGEFDGGMGFTGASTAYMTTNVSGGSWVPFRLHPELSIDALTWGDAAEVGYTRGKESGQFWVRLPESAEVGSFLQMSSSYRGKVGEWSGNWFYLQSISGWYPSTAGTSAAFDITFRAPESLPIVSIGKRESLTVEDGIATSHWVQSQPFDYASYNVGQFREYSFPSERVPPVRVHINERAHSGLPLASQQRDAQDFVANDITTSLSFFQNTMGTLDNEEFSITEIPAMHGQAFPGMIHLSFATFGMSREESVNQRFRAHEVAHQWWGITVRPWSYRDQWLGEGMAEFSSLWYLEAVGGVEAALDMLREYRDRIVGRRDATGPTGLGPRVVVGAQDSDHQTMIYEKGAWVGHMIRHLLIDYETTDEAVLRAFLTDVVNRYRNRRMSTGDFQAVLEEYVQGDMTWFFDQWINGTAVPDYFVAHRGETDRDGKYQLQLRVRQENVPDDFRMIVPVFLDFGEGKSSVVRMMVSGPETIQEMALPAEPVAVRLNPFEAVLARVKTEKW